MSLTRSSVKQRPSRLTSSPSSSRRTVVTDSRSALSGDRGLTPIWRIQAATPVPMPGCNRPGYIRSSVAISIASSAGWRTIAETTPSPIGIRSVAASAAAAPEIPPVKK